MFSLKCIFEALFDASHLCSFLLSHNYKPTNYKPLETAVIKLGNNLRFILPHGAIAVPVTSTSSPALTPVTRVLTPPCFTVRQTSHPPVLTPVQRCRPTAPVIIPAQAIKRFSHSASVASLSAPAAPAPQAVVQPNPKVR